MNEKAEGKRANDMERKFSKYLPLLAGMLLLAAVIFLCVGRGESEDGERQGDGACLSKEEEKKEERKHNESRNENDDVESEITVAISSDSGGFDPAGNIALTYLSYSVTALDELLTYDANGEIEYRAAVRYEVNDDFSAWTFHLREGALWSDGSDVTAADFVNTMVRALNPASGSSYVNYLFPIQNAEAIYQGEADVSSLGVETPDAYTLVFYLERPCVYFLDLLRLPVYMPSCAKYTATEGERRRGQAVLGASDLDGDAATDGKLANPPEAGVSNGPFRLTEYVPEQYFVLEKNPYYWNADAVELERITYRFFDSQEAMAVAYESGVVDVACALPSIVAELYAGRDDLLITEAVATRYIYPNLHVEPLDDVRVRKALSLAIDREELCEMAGAETEPTVHFIAKYMVDKATGAYYAEEMETPFAENVEEARCLLAEAGYPDGEGFPKLSYKYPSLELDADVAQVLQEQWRKNLGIEVELSAQELQVNYSERKAGNFDLCRMNWTADFADPYTYLSLLLSNSTYNCSGICDLRYDMLVQKSDAEMDSTRRSELIWQAEKLAVGEEYYVIPLFSVKNVNLIQPGIEGITQIPATGALEYRYARVAR